MVVHWIVFFALLLGAAETGRAAEIVPQTVRMPGTQPGEVGNLQTANRCDNCHGGYNPAAEPAHLWNGSMMAHAAADPIFWATVAVAEQDFDGSGDLCLRCHMPKGWLAGRSTPTDGTGLSASSDSDGVECDFCHQLTDPVAQVPQPVGVQNPGFEAFTTGGEAHYGSGQYVMYDGNEKLGPYDDADARHQWTQSSFLRSSNFCGTCHDVSNPVVGNLASNHGTLAGADPVIADGALDGDLATKAAFNNPPYRYGVIERTYSEHMASDLATTSVSDADPTRTTVLPDELKQGAILRAYDAAFLASGGVGTDYADGTPRSFTCQSCHMPPIAGVGCDKVDPNLPRADMPRHDLVGGNYWMLEVMPWMESRGTLPFGGGFAAKADAMRDGIARARSTLQDAGALSIEGDSVKVLNLTGHKLISGYPEGRRMWLRIDWKDAADQTLRVDGEYGDLQLQMDVSGDGIVDVADTVRTILDLEGTNTRIYQVHAGISQDWATTLLSLHDPSLPVAFDRSTGGVTATLQSVAEQPAGTAHESFHFVLNNEILADNRIPPWRMNREAARQRNTLPVPADQYGNPGPTGVFDHFDLVPLSPPPQAVGATIDLLYQSTSWEYIQFLYLANNGQNAFLGETGANLLEAWLNVGDGTVRMAEPQVIASTTYFVPEPARIAMLLAGLGLLALLHRRRESRPPRAYTRAVSSAPCRPPTRSSSSEPAAISHAAS